ncbi:MAG: FAD-dependent oxidoreductase [Oscillospiraceae bacterium]|nr:FAD-dependent oxidoreductase [Oscillospiraceae bacterium]
MKHVIIGNSAAAIGCVEGIRRASRTDDIVLVAAEPHHTYSRPLISYLMAGKTDRTKIRYRPENFYRANGVQAKLGRRALGIDPAGKIVTLDGGETIAYDNVLVATGSDPLIFPAEGLDQVENVRTFTTLDDAEALLRSVTAETRVFVVGAGLIGLKCAEGLRAITEHITVCDLAPRVLSSILEDAPAAILRRHLEENGIVLKLGTSVSSFARAGAACTATLRTGETVPFDQLVYAAGVRPNTALVKDAGGDVNRGILVDTLCRTSLPDVYAAGDCTESPDACSGERKVMALLPNAYLQGETAGITMAGATAPTLPLLPMNAIGFFGLHLLCAGVYDGERTEHTDGQNYRSFYTRDNTLRGYILLGRVERAGIYTALIRGRTPLDALDFAALRDQPGLIAFAGPVRAEILRNQDNQRKREAAAP